MTFTRFNIRKIPNNVSNTVVINKINVSMVLFLDGKPFEKDTHLHLIANN